MGKISPRLARLYDAYIPTYAAPIIVTTIGPPSPQITQAAQSAGAGPITFTSQLINAFGTTATKTVADIIAKLPTVKEVHADEPTLAL